MSLRIAHISDLHIFDIKAFEKFLYESIDPPIPMPKSYPTSPGFGTQLTDVNISAWAEARKSHREWKKWLNSEEGQLWNERFRDFSEELIPRLYALGGVHPDCLDTLLKYISNERVDHIIITGDITNTSNRREYQIFLEKFGDFIEKGKVSVVPGNHDTQYLPNSVSFLEMIDHLIPNQYPSFLKTETKKKTRFPYIKELNEDICLIGLNSTKEGSSLNILERLITNSRGEISNIQIRELESLFSNNVFSSKFQIVALHHHIVDIPSELKKEIKPAPYFMDKLKNASDILKLLEQAKVRLVLNGHVHHKIKPKNKNRNVLPQIFTSAHVFQCYKSINFKIFDIDINKMNPKVEPVSHPFNARRIQESRVSFILKRLYEIIFPFIKNYPRRKNNGVTH